MFVVVQFATGLLLGAGIVVLAPTLTWLPPDWLLFVIALSGLVGLGSWLWWLYRTGYAPRPWAFAGFMLLGAIGGSWL